MKNRISAKINELFGIDVRSLALMRVGFSLIVLYDFIFERLANLTAHYGNGGVFPSSLIHSGVWTTPHPELFNLMDKFPALPLVVLLIGIVAAVFLLIGWKTRVASVFVWLAVFIMQLLNPIILQGGDIMLRVYLFIGMFLPWGRAFSVDAALRYGREVPKRFLSAWSAAFLFQVSFVYFSAVLLKTGVEWTTNGTAVYYALSLDQFSTPIGEFTRQFPAFMMFLTFGVTTLQASVFFLLFSPVFTFLTRSIATFGLLVMHFSFALHMNLGPFSWISMTGVSAFLTTRLWDSVERWASTHFGNLTIYYDGDCGFCKKSSHLIRTFLILPKTEILPAQTNPEILKEMEAKDSWVIVTKGGAHHFSYGAGIALLAASPLLYWIAPIFNLSMFRPIGEHVYRFIADHRKRVCLPDKPKWMLPEIICKLLWTVSTILALSYIVAVSAWNYSNIPSARFRLNYPIAYYTWMRGLGLDQMWNMFAPYPLKDDGWYAITGIEQNGASVNLANPGWKIPTIEKPENVSALYPDERWRKYLMNLWSADFSTLRYYYLAYLCRDWNDHHKDGEKLIQTNMTFYLEETLPDYTTAPIQPIELARQQCSGESAK